MNKLIPFLLVLITGTAQAQSFSWAKALIGDPFPGTTSVATDGSGNVYVTGSYNTPIDVDPGVAVVNLSPSAGTDTYILKLDASGNFVWVKELKSVSGSSFVFSTDIAIDGAGNILVTGSFDGVVDFDPGTGTTSLTGVNSDAFLVKLDNTGSFVYAHSMGGSGSDGSRALCVDNQNNVMVTGTFESIADFDPTAGTSNLVSLGMEDVFVARFDDQGAFEWAVSRGSTGSETTFTIVADAAGGIFGSTSSADTLTVFRLDDMGAFTWVNQLSSSSGQMNLRRLALDPNGGDIYATGSFTGSMDFDPGTGTFPMTANSMDMFLLKLNNSGNFAWAKMIDALGIVTNATINVFDQNNVYVAASYSGTADLDPGPGVNNVTAVSGAPDIFIARFNTLGNFISGGTMGGSIDDAMSDMAISSTGEVILSGNFRETADFDPGSGVSSLTSPASTYSVFVVKLSGTTGINDLRGVATNVRIYPNPSTGTVVIETDNNDYDTYSLQNSTGQLIYTKAMSGSSTHVALSELAPGVYYVKLSGKKGTVTSRFTKL